MTRPRRASIRPALVSKRLMLGLHLPRAPYDLPTIFRTVFRHRRHDCGLRPVCLHLYGHRAISLTGFYSGPMQSRRQTVRRSYGDRAVIVLSPQPCIEIARTSNGALAASVQRPFGYRTVAV